MAKRQALLVVLRRRTLIAMVTLAAVTTVGIAAAPELHGHHGSLSGRTIVVDPGHGGIDGGAVVGSVVEKALNLQMGLQLRRSLESRGATVRLTRSSDVSLDPVGPPLTSRHRRDLAARAMIASGSGGVLVSLHMDSSRKAATHGPSVFYEPGNEESAKLAADILPELERVMGPTPRGCCVPKHHYVTRNARVPAILVEVGFLTSAGDRGLLTNPKQLRRVAEALSVGLTSYFGSAAPAAGAT